MVRNVTKQYHLRTLSFHLFKKFTGSLHQQRLGTRGRIRTFLELLINNELRLILQMPLPLSRKSRFTLPYRECVSHDLAKVKKCAAYLINFHVVR